MLTRQNIIALLFYVVLSLAAVDLAMDHRNGYLIGFLSIPSFLIVISFSGLTYIKRERYMLHELGLVLKKDMILGGWMGFLLGCFITFYKISIWNIDVLHSIAGSMLSIIYGYVLGNLVESFWPYVPESYYEK